MSGRRRTIALLGAAALAAPLAGCGLGAGEQAGGIGLRVTDDFGRVAVATPERPEQEGQDTVMRLLRRNVERVDTRYGGGFVQAIDGLAGEASGERLVDWFFYVNGVLAGRGSADWRLRDGEQIWWDRHRWDLAEVDAVVGSYPEPMKSGHGGRWKGALLDCRGEPATCDAAGRRLRAAGITVTRGAASDADAEQTRIVVGPWQQIRTAAPELPRLERGPEHSGVFADIGKGSGRVVPLLASGKGTGHGSLELGLIAALRDGDRSPVWVVTGMDDSTVSAAVRRLTVGDLAGKPAVAMTPEPSPGGPPARLEALPLRAVPEGW